jgi:hypothetical protein
MRVLLGLTLTACTPERPPPARVVHVRVVDDESRPIGAVPLELDGISTLTTAPDGTANISLAPDGSPRARIGVSCPPHMRAVEPRHVARAAPGGSAPLDLTFACRPKLRTVVVVVRAPGAAGLTVRADGEPLGELDSGGTFHALLTRPPHTELRLSVDTGDSPLVPQSPTRALRIADRDAILVFDQAFASTARPRTRATPAPAKASSAPARSVPYAIRGSGS